MSRNLPASLFRHTFSFGAALMFVLSGCDKDDTRDAAQTAGEKTEQAVNAIGDASRDAVHTIKRGAEAVGDKVQEAGHDLDASTRRAATAP